MEPFVVEVTRLLESERLDEARARVAEEETRDPALHQFGLAMLAAHDNDPPQALEHFARLFALRPTDPSPIAAMLEVYTEAGRVMGAMAVAELVRGRGDASPEGSVMMDLLDLHLLKALLKEFPARGTVDEADGAVDRLLATAARATPGLRLAAARTLIDCQRFDEARHTMRDVDEGELDEAERAFLVEIVGLLRT